MCLKPFFSQTIHCCDDCLQLTKVGGGVFGNDQAWIASAIQSALNKFEAEPLDVELIHYNEEDMPKYKELKAPHGG